MRRQAWRGEIASKYSTEDILRYENEIRQRKIEGYQPSTTSVLDTEEGVRTRRLGQERSLADLSFVQLPLHLVRKPTIPKLKLPLPAAPPCDETRQRRSTFTRSKTPRGMTGSKAQVDGPLAPATSRELLDPHSLSNSFNVVRQAKKTPTQEIEEFRRMIRLNTESDAQHLSTEDIALADLFEEPESPSNLRFADDEAKSGWAVHITASNAEGIRSTSSLKPYCNAQVWFGVISSALLKRREIDSPRTLPRNFAEGQLLREKTKRGQVEATSSVAPRTTSPYWNETFTLFAKEGDRLVVEVQDVARLSSNPTAIGTQTLAIPFDRANDQALSWVPQWLDLKNPKDGAPAGRLCIRLWVGAPNSKPSGRQMYVRKRVLLAASPAKIVYMLTESQGIAAMGKGRQVYASTFLLTFRSVVKPLELMHLLRIRFLQPAPSFIAEEERSRWQYQNVAQIQLHVVNTLRMWIEQHPYDFAEDEKLLNDFTELTAVVRRVNTKLGDILNRSFEKFQKRPEVGSMTYKDASCLPLMKPPKAGVPFTWRDVPPLEFARQLTLADEDHWIKLRPWELQGQPWVKTSALAGCPNVAGLIGTHNRIKNWIVSEVLAVDDVKERAVVLIRLIMIADELKNLHNFHSAMSIVAGLNSATVIRLRNSWTLLPSKIATIWEALGVLFSVESNYINLRDTMLHTAAPAIPYIGLFMKDLTFIEDGNPDHIDTLINFTKLEMIAGILKTIQIFQQRKYAFTPLFFLQDYLSSLSIDTPDEKAQFDRSLQLCPRAAK